MTLAEHDDDDLLDDGPEATTQDVSDVEAAVSSIIQQDTSWKPATVLELGPERWRPHLQNDDATAIVYVHLSDRLYTWQRKRLKAAHAAGLKIHVATSLALLFDDELVRALCDADAEVIILKPNGLTAKRHILATLADEGIAVTAETRKLISESAWAVRTEGAAHVRGRRFEALLAFLLAQVQDFKIIERNFRGDTDEIDIVVQLTHVSNRCWYESGVPFLLVEGKNWVSPVDQKEISAFITKLQTKRGKARIGLFFGASGFTSDAVRQEAKLAMTNFVVVLLGPNEIRGWMTDDHPSEFLERIVRHAMLA